MVNFVYLCSLLDFERVNMTRNTLFLWLCLLGGCCLGGCNAPADLPVLLQADSLAVACPDSALVLLERIRPEMERASDPVRMYYRLLCIKAADKAYVPHTATDSIDAVLRYYVAQDDLRRLPEAFYYAGRVYRDLGDAPQALRFFQEALDVMKRKGADRSVEDKVYSQMGSLFLFMDLNRQSREAFRKSLELDQARNDTVGMIYDLRDIAVTYQEYPLVLDSVMWYTREACRLAKFLDDPYMDMMMQGDLAKAYMLAGRLDEAGGALRLALHHHRTHARSGVYAIASDYYRLVGKNDSAFYYCRELLTCGTIYAKQHAHFFLAQEALKKQESQQAFTHLLQVQLCMDSIRNLENVDAVRRIDAQYNYKLQEKKNLSLEKERGRHLQIIRWSIGVLVLLTCVGGIYWWYNRRKRRFLINRGALLEKLLEEQQEKLRQVERQVQDEQNAQTEAVSQLRQTEICRWFQEQAGKDASSSSVRVTQWNALKEEIARYYPQFFEKLYALTRLSEQEERVCMLIKIGLSSASIARLTNRSPEAISSTRRRLCVKVFHREGCNPKEWNAFIESL